MSVGERSRDEAPSSPDVRRAPPAIKRRPGWLDWLDSTDPGLMRLRMATEVVVAVGLSDLELRASARRVDVAYQALAATVRPMRTPLLGRLASRVAGFMATTVAARHYARNLLLDASTRYVELDPAAAAELAAARRQLIATKAPREPCLG